MKSVKKGNFGYIKSQRIIEIIKTLVLLALCIAIYRIGIYSTGSNKNLLTFVAILGVLPMARFAVSAVLFIKAKGCSDELKAKIDATGVSVNLYDLFLTDYKQNYQLSALYFKRGTLIAVSEDPSIKLDLAEEHIRKVLENIGISSVFVKVYNEPDKFIDRMLELNALEDDGRPFDNIIENMLSVSI